MEDIAQVHTLPQKSIDERLDDFQIALSELEPVECPIINVFSPGLYGRKILMKAFSENSKGEIVNTVIISKIHKTRHQFCILKGSVAVFNKQDDFLGILEAGHSGITEPGTRRILQIIEDCTWQTFHPLPYITGEENNWSESQKEALLMKIEKDLIEEREVSGCHL